MRLLLVTYYYPPSGGAGVQRPTKWAKYLPEFGVEPVVLTVREGAYPSRDLGLVDEVRGVETVRTAAPDPFGVYGALTGRSREQAVSDRSGRIGGETTPVERLARWLRGNLFVPDARIGWLPFALAGARRLHRETPVDAILTTGPPHSVHLIGRALKRAWRLPWIADFRDPWTSINYYEDLPMSAPVRRLDKRLERSVLQEADAVLTVSPSLARQIDADGALAAGTTHVVHNGYDAADLPAPEARHVRTDAFVLSHVGSLYAARNPIALWTALTRLRADGEIPKLVVRLVGRVGAEVVAAARATGVDVDVEPYVPHEAAVREMASSGLLLLSIEPFASEQAERGIMTGKLYEYLASGRPVLGLGPPDGDAAALLRHSDGGVLLPRDDAEGVADVIRTHYDAWRRGEPLAGADAEAIQPYSRRKGAEQLRDILRQLLSHPNSPTQRHPR